MVCVGIDVAKDKHDCCILDSDGTVRADCFTIPNNMDGFKQLIQTIRDCTQKSDKIKVGLEATGHYSYNILGFLLDNDLPVYVMNLLHTNLYRKSLSLRKTKTDRVDARTIATFMLTPVALHLHTSLENSQAAMLTWKSEVHAICDMRFTMQPNTFTIGILSLPNTLPRNVPKESTTMLPCPMPQRNSCG